MTHTKHPKCPLCRKSLYKGKQKGNLVKKKDPYAYCRNENCDLIGRDQTDRKKIKPRYKRRAVRVKKPKESKLVRDVRTHVRLKLQKGEPASYLLTIVVIAQELGFNDMANILIDKFNLKELFGILKKE